MADLVGLKVSIGLGADGSAQYPNFNSLDIVNSSGMNWSKYVDKHGSGWIYSCCGHKEEASGSPFGQQWGMILVPAEFATQAVAAFPGTCSVMTQVEVEEFYNNDHAKYFPEEDIDESIIQKISAKQDLGIPLSQEDRQSLDVRDSRSRGIKQNRRKRFKLFKQDRGFNVIDPP